MLKYNYFRPEPPPPPVDRPKITLFHAWFHHEMKFKKNSVREWAGDHGPAQLRRRLLAPERRAVHCLKPAAGCRRHLAIAVDKCCHWLQQMPHEYSNMSC